MNTQTKTIIIITLLVFISLGLLAGYFLVINTGKSVNEITVEDAQQFFNFGETVPSERQVSESEVGGVEKITQTQERTGVLPILRQISSEPVAGFISSSTQNIAVNSIRYVEKATGHIYETNTDSLVLQKISNTTIPKIYESIWTGYNSVIFRYLGDDKRTIESFYGEIQSNDATSTVSSMELEGVFLSKNIKEITSTNGQIFYLTVGGGVSRGVTAKSNGDNKLEVWRAPLTEWLIQWPEERTITLTTKPSQGVQGLLFFLNSKSGKFDKILSGLGLTTLTNRNVSKVLYSVNSGNNLVLKVYDMKKDVSLDLSLRTISDKCVWAGDNITVYCGVPKTLPAGDYPDFWYQGVISFSDDIWKINTETGATDFIVSPEDILGQQFDIIKPALSSNNYFIFINKKDSTLWSYRI